MTHPLEARAGKAIPVRRRRLRTVDFNHALKLQMKGQTLREISKTLGLPLDAIKDDLYWDVRK